MFKKKGKKGKGKALAMILIPLVLVVGLVGVVYAFISNWLDSVAKDLKPSSLLNTVEEAGAAMATGAYAKAKEAGAEKWTQVVAAWDSLTSDDDDDWDAPKYGTSENP